MAPFTPISKEAEIDLLESADENLLVRYLSPLISNTLDEHTFDSLEARDDAYHTVISTLPAVREQYLEEYEEDEISTAYQFSTYFSAYMHHVVTHIESK